MWQLHRGITRLASPLRAGSEVACGWQLSLPVLDPAAILTLAVFQQSRGGKAKGRPGFLPNSAVQVSGAGVGLGLGIARRQVQQSGLRPPCLPAAA